MSRLTSRIANRSRALTALAAMGVVATATLLAPAIASAAQPAADAPRTTVTYSYGDLASDQGTRALYERIKRAARSVCPTYDPLDLDAYSANRECQRQAIANAVRHIGSQRLAALYMQTTARKG